MIEDYGIEGYAEIRRILQAEVERNRRLIMEAEGIRPEVKLKGSKKRPVIDLSKSDYQILPPSLTDTEPYPPSKVVSRLIG